MRIVRHGMKEANKFMNGETRGKIMELIERLFQGEWTPQEWRTGIISDLCKKEDRKAVENFRGITLFNTAYKIYAVNPNKRIKKEIETYKKYGGY